MSKLTPNNLTLPGHHGDERVDLDTAAFPRLQQADRDLRRRRDLALERAARAAARLDAGRAAGEMLDEDEAELVETARHRRNAMRAALDRRRAALRRWAFVELFHAWAAQRRTYRAYEVAAGLLGAALGAGLAAGLERLAATRSVERQIARANESAEADTDCLLRLGTEFVRRDARAGLEHVSDTDLQALVRLRRSELLAANSQIIALKSRSDTPSDNLRSAQARAVGQLQAVEDEIAWRFMNGGGGGGQQQTVRHQPPPSDSDGEGVPVDRGPHDDGGRDGEALEDEDDGYGDGHDRPRGT